MSETWTANLKALNAAIAQLAASKEARGIKQKGGKKYTVVADRVEAFRTHFGDMASIQTEILHYSPKDKAHPIVVQACIYMWDNGTSPRLVATGFAEEWRDEGYVNATSALENCETSAIGRALANLGLHGGEYASANEIDIAETKQAHLSKGPKVQVIPQAGVKIVSVKLDGVKIDMPEVDLKDTLAPAADIAPEFPDPKVQPEAPAAQIGWETMVDAVEAFLPLCDDVDGLKKFWERNLNVINDLREKSPKDFATVKAMFAARKAFLKGK